MTQPQHLADAERIDAVCDRFEDDLRAGRPMRIEDCLTSVDESLRLRLCRALLGIEIEVLMQEGLPVDRDDYRRRFPELGDAVDAALDSVCLAGDAERKVSTDAAQSSVVGGFLDTSRDLGCAKEPAKLERLGRFEIRQLLGEGSFGTVYHAYDPRLDREVALKVPRAGLLQTDEDRRRFLREARSAAGLHHPQICPVYEAGTIDGRDYIVMAWIDGQPLSKVLADGTRLSDRQVASAIRRIALALQEAHEKGIVHRDLKPANIMISRRGEPVVMDFGLARRDNPLDAHISVSGQIMGTPAYMSPEQTRGDGRAVGPQSDVYSLGIVMYEMLCRRRPFEGSVSEVLGQILHVCAEPPTTHRAGIDPRLAAICMKAIAKAPGDRYASMGEFAAALGEFTKATSGASASTLPAPAAQSDATVGATATVSESAARGSGPSQKSATRVEADSADIDSNVGRAAERASETASGPHRPKSWRVAAGFALLAGILLLGILFVVRKDTVTVVINIPIDTKDPALSFTLDEKTIAADALASPIELKPGEHELLVHRDDRLYRRFLFNVGRNDNQPVVVQDVTPRAVTPDAKPVAAAPVKPQAEPPKPASVSGLDALDPADEKFDWQPQELVAVYGTHRARHWGEVRGIAISRDGKLLATGGLHDRVIRLWDTGTMREIGRLDGHRAGLHALAISPDGTRLISMSSDQTLRLWDVPGRQELKNVETRALGVTSLAISSDGRRALTGGRDGEVRLWDVETLAPLKSFGKHSKPVLCVAFAPDDRIAASGGEDRTVQVFDLETGENRQTWDAFAASVRSLAFSPDGGRLAIGSGDEREGVPNGQRTAARIFDTTTGKLVTLLAGRATSACGSIFFLKDGKQALTWFLEYSGESLHLQTWDVQSAATTGAFRSGRRQLAIRSVVPSRDDRWVYTGGTDGRVRKWNLATGEDESVGKSHHDSWISDVSFSADDSRLVTGSRDFTIGLWNTLPGQPPRFLDDYPDGEWNWYAGPRWGALSPDRKRLITTGDTGSQFVCDQWDVAAWKKAGSLGPDVVGEGVDHDPVFLPDSRRLLLSHGRFALVWDATTSKVIHRFEHPNGVNYARPSRDGTRAITGCEDKLVRVWDLESGNLVSTLTGHMGAVGQVELCPTGRFAASISSDLTVRLWDLDAGPQAASRVLPLFDPDEERWLSPQYLALTFSPDGRTLAATGGNAKLLFWNVASGESTRRIALPGNVHDLAWASDSRHLATGNANGTVYVLRIPRLP